MAIEDITKRRKRWLSNPLSIHREKVVFAAKNRQEMELKIGFGGLS